MLKNSKNNGITLIALVITIIVLLILAGISISMLSGDNSILRKAAEAKEKSETTGVKEQVQIATMSAITEKTGQIADATLRSELKKNLSGLSDNDITGNEKYGWQVKIGKKAYSISSSGEVNEAFWEEVKDSNGNVTEIRRVDGTITELKIGDVIGYSAIDGVENRTITSLGTVTGLGEGNNQTIEIEAGTCKLLGVENGKLKIISDIVGRTPESSESGVFASKVLNLFGKVGYQNAEEELNRVCSLYGKGKYAEIGRSIDVEDINKITGYNPDAVGIKNPTANQISNGTKYNQGDNKPNQYGREVTYLWSGNVDKKPQYTYTGKETTGTLTNAHNSFNWYNERKWNVSNYEFAKIGKICTLISNYYYYYPTTLTNSNSGNVVGIETDTNIYKLLFDKNNFGSGNNEYYWLSSRCINNGLNLIGFGIRCVYSNRVYAVNMANSDDSELYYKLGLRPIVYLKSDIKLKKNENGVWQFIDN